LFPPGVARIITPPGRGKPGTPMTVLQVARMGQPVLRRPAAPVAVPADADLRRLIDDMVETLHAQGGTGIAAPQVFAAVRVIAFFVDGGRAQRRDRALGLPAPADPADAAVDLTVLLNPELAPLEPDAAPVEDWEACLSIPGLTGLVPRWPRIRYRGWSPDGRRIARTATGFHARVVQHELDHLDGVLYPDRLRRLDTLIFASEIDSYRADA
jgi:peptide deformylase